MAWEALDDGSGYFLVPYDAHGAEVTTDDGLASDGVIDRLREEPVTDVIVVSHGWNGDVPAARSQYRRWLAAMAATPESRRKVLDARPDFHPLVVGLHWPSKAWGDEDIGGASFGVGLDGTGGPTSAVSVESLVDEYAARLVDTERTRSALRTIFDAALDDVQPETLPERVREAYAAIDEETSQGNDGVGGAPGDDREPFDAAQAYDEVLEEEDVVDFGGPGLGGLLAPLRTLTFWQMKRRARTFGESGAADLLRRLQASAPPERGVRYHLVGHSFGCIVAAACVAGPTADDAVQVDSLVLIQGALSLWSLCSSIPASPDRPGYFHRLVSSSQVRGPILVTMSEHDRAVGFFYPLGARAGRQLRFDGEDFPTYGGMGTFGARGPMLSTDNQVLHDLDEPYALQPGTIYNLEASHVIATGSGASGAHSDICHPEVAHAVWSAIAAAP